MGTLIQFAAYLGIFRHLSHHDKTMASLLPETTIRKRRRKNAIDLTGHAVNMALSVALTIVMLGGIHWMSSNVRLWTLIMLKSNFGVSGLLHMFSSPPLRNDLKSVLAKLQRAFHQSWGQLSSGSHQSRTEP